MRAEALGEINEQEQLEKEQLELTLGIRKAPNNNTIKEDPTGEADDDEDVDSICVASVDG